MTRTIPLFLGAVAFASLAGMSSAEAGHGGAHFSGHVSGSFHAGGAHFSGGAHVNVGVHYSRGGYGGYHGYPGRYGVGGHIYVGGCWGCGWGYPYYGSYYYPEYVPSYYGASYYPVQAPAAVAVAAPLRPELPRFGIGIAGGSVYTTDVDNTNQHQSDDLAFLARMRLTPGLILEGELGKTTYDQNSSASTAVWARR